jgi:hypothetical protein
VENVRSSPTENEEKVVSLMWSRHLKNLIKFVTEGEISESMEKMGLDQKTTSLMLTKHMINLAKDVKEKGSLRIGINSLVISWFGMKVASALRRNSSEPMVGWKGEHPYSVSWRKPVIDNYSHILCH